MNTLIVIPARYGSKRFPGKPLAKLAGKEILLRVYETAVGVCRRHTGCQTVIATEEPEIPGAGSDLIVQFCHKNGLPVVLTPGTCRSGSDRAWAVAEKMAPAPDVIVNLQGDNPLCPPEFLDALINAFENNPRTQVATAYTRMSWDTLDILRESKKNSPFSGTTVIVGADGNAKWFSKNIIPALRGEEKLRSAGTTSPVCRHVGLYAYSFEALKFFSGSQQSQYEQLEQLEQLRFLENNIPVRMVEVVYPAGLCDATSGIDTAEDLQRAEKLLQQLENRR